MPYNGQASHVHQAQSQLQLQPQPQIAPTHYTCYQLSKDGTSYVPVYTTTDPYDPYLINQHRLAQQLQRPYDELYSQQRLEEAMRMQSVLQQQTQNQYQMNAPRYVPTPQRPQMYADNRAAETRLYGFNNDYLVPRRTIASPQAYRGSAAHGQSVMYPCTEDIYYTNSDLRNRASTAYSDHAGGDGPSSEHSEARPMVDSGMNSHSSTPINATHHEAHSPINHSWTLEDTQHSHIHVNPNNLCITPDIGRASNHETSSIKSSEHNTLTAYECNDDNAVVEAVASMSKVAARVRSAKKSEMDSKAQAQAAGQTSDEDSLLSDCEDDESVTATEDQPSSRLSRERDFTPPLDVSIKIDTEKAEDTESEADRQTRVDSDSEYVPHTVSRPRRKCITSARCANEQPKRGISLSLFFLL